MSSSINQKAISAIPVVVIGNQPVRSHYHWKRRAVQTLTILLAVLIPASGLFRIDPEMGGFMVLDRQIWLSDFFLMAGLWVFLASSLVILYSTAGTVFCGWSCPQNTLAEWANNLTRKLLGKRAEVSLTGERPRVAAAKDKIVNWALLGLAFLGASMFFALIPLFYFYPPTSVWSFITWRHDPELAGSLHWIYAVFTVIILLDITLIRHFWCRFACVYRVWQHSFKTKQTLHVAYDASRADACAKCNYCATSCFIDLDPRKTDVYDSCINCGDCIDACNQLQAKNGTSGLLRFEMNERKLKAESKFRSAAISLFARIGWMAPIAASGAAMLAWGLWSYEPYHITVGRVSGAYSSTAQEYQIMVSNKLYRAAVFKVGVRGLAQDGYKLGTHDIRLPSVGRESVKLLVTHELAPGLYPLVVEIQAEDGWKGQFRIQHFVE